MALNSSILKWVKYKAPHKTTPPYPRPKWRWSNSCTTAWFLKIFSHFSKKQEVLLLHLGTWKVELRKIQRATGGQPENGTQLLLQDVVCCTTSPLTKKEQEDSALGNMHVRDNHFSRGGGQMQILWHVLMVPTTNGKYQTWPSQTWNLHTRPRLCDVQVRRLIWKERVISLLSQPRKHCWLAKDAYLAEQC